MIIDWNLDEYLAKHLKKSIDEIYSEPTYPTKSDLFRAFELCSFKDTKVVIIGQDPYHNGSADGLCFSSKTNIPASLRVIYKELADDGFPQPNHGDLTRWAIQGVLLINSILTVSPGIAASHVGLGWEEVIQEVISDLYKKETPIVFIYWGVKARRFTQPTSIHLNLTAAHPAAECYGSGGFYGCKHFSKTNTFLKDRINW